MPPTDGSLSAPGQGPVRSVLSRLRHSYDAAPLPVKALILIVSCVFFLPLMLGFAPYAVWAGRRGGLATAAVALWGRLLVATQARAAAAPHYARRVLPVGTGSLAPAAAPGPARAPCPPVTCLLLRPPPP